MTASSFNIEPQYLPGAAAGDIAPLDIRPRTMFRAPHCTNIDELDADVAFIGMPFDQGTLGRPGARYGPDALRDAPRAYSYADPYSTGADAGGFFDADAGDELLRGITMADCGNVSVTPSDVVHNFERLAGGGGAGCPSGRDAGHPGRRPRNHLSGGGRPGAFRPAGHRAF